MKQNGNQKPLASGKVSWAKTTQTASNEVQKAPDLVADKTKSPWGAPDGYFVSKLGFTSEVVSQRKAF